MAVYSNKKDGNKYISEHFQIKEFACKDGSDKILLDIKLVEILEDLRKRLNSSSCHVTSGYRTPGHNKKIGGSRTSQHMKGKAADVVFKDQKGNRIPSKNVCAAAQDIDCDGIGYIGTYSTHIDVRGRKWWADERYGNKKIKDFYQYFCIVYPTPKETVKRGDKGTPVRWVQYNLAAKGYPVSIDGSFGGKTEKAVKRYQQDNKLTVDGRVGKNTRNSLLGL